MSVAPRVRFGVVDVRDVAGLHLRAMAAPRAAGKRYLAVSDGPALSFAEVAGILRRRLGDPAALAPTAEAALEAGRPEPPRPVVHNDRARQELGWRPRPAETTIVESAESLRDLGLLSRWDPACGAGLSPGNPWPPWPGWRDHSSRGPAITAPHIL